MFIFITLFLPFIRLVTAFVLLPVSEELQLERKVGRKLMVGLYLATAILHCPMQAVQFKAV